MTRTWRPRLAVAMWIVVLGLHIVGTSAQGTIREADGNQALTFVSPPPRRGWSPPGHTRLGTRLRSLRSPRSGPQECAIFDGP